MKKMDNKGNNIKTKKAGRTEENTGGKAARVRRMRKGLAKTSGFREANSDTLYNERDVK